MYVNIKPTFLTLYQFTLLIRFIIYLNVNNINKQGELAFGGIFLGSYLLDTVLSCTATELQVV